MRSVFDISRVFAVLIFGLCLLPAGAAHADVLKSLTHEVPANMSDLPRYAKLPLFNPHRKSFTCIYEAQHLPPSDPQAELWFQQALALDNPDVWFEDIDWKRVYQLYLQAAERGHWKSMLNLASLILSDYAVPDHNPESAIRWVEKAMQLGVPDAWDRMGTYHQSGLVKGGNATTAYAFFQHAADMGSPAAMTFLGYKMAGTYDDPDGEFWGNLPIGTKMLECAFAQGNGDAAEKLAFIYARSGTTDAKLRALNVLQEGVRSGSAACANSLFTEFDGFNLSNGRNLVGHVDKARAERYSKIGDALEHYKGRLKLPNLDKVLPLPPATLPKWGGDVKTLLDAAKAVAPPPKPNKGAALNGREHIGEGQGVLSLAKSLYAVAGDTTVPETGYWLATYGLSTTANHELRFARSGRPERYEAGERFEPPTSNWLTLEQVQWHYLGEAYALPPQREDFAKHMIDVGLLRGIPEPDSPLQCAGQQRCPQTGVWEGRVADDHPLAALYNRWDQQAFVEKGRAFPNPAARFIDIAADDVRWTYLGSPNEEMSVPGIFNIGL